MRGRKIRAVNNPYCLSLNRAHEVGRYPDGRAARRAWNRFYQAAEKQHLTLLVNEERCHLTYIDGSTLEVLRQPGNYVSSSRAEEEFSIGEIAAMVQEGTAGDVR